MKYIDEIVDELFLRIGWLSIPWNMFANLLMKYFYEVVDELSHKKYLYEVGDELF